MSELNPSQKQAAEFKGKHLLVLAGAGTGKTKTIIARAEYLLKEGIQPKNIAILSFTRKSAKEIAERLKLSVSDNVNKASITGKTFHSWCNEIMRLFPEYFPHHSFTPLDEDDRLSAFNLVIGKNFKDAKNQKVSKDVVAAIYSYRINTQCSFTDSIFHIRYQGANRENEQVKKDLEEDKILLTPVIQRYIEYKKEKRYIDYDDMLSVVADVLEKNPTVRDAVNKRYKHILVDEVQDTNPLQFKLLRSFVENSHLFCVGDDAQSIYAFRGADFKTIHSFTSIIPNSEVQKLELNYRSTQEILDLSNWLLAESDLDYKKNLKAFRGIGEKPCLVHVDDDWDEAEAITNDIVKHFTEGGKYSESMVLGRSSFALSKVEGNCLAKKIPYVKLGGTSLMQSAHVRDVVSALRITTNIYDEIAWIRYLQLWEGIGNVKATKLISELTTLEDLDNMIDRLQSIKMKELVPEISSTLAAVKNYVNNPSLALKTALLHLEKLMEKTYREDWNFRKTDFEVLEEVAKSTASITEFITEYVLDPKAETTLKFGVKTDEDAVILSTIHSAKGLEAQIVHIINVNPFNFPSSRTIQQGDAAVEEERRCLYVAMTRAKDKLYLYRFTRSMHTQYADNDQNEHNLYFLNNLPSNLITSFLDGKENEEFPKFNQKDNRIADFPDFEFN